MQKKKLGIAFFIIAICLITIGFILNFITKDKKELESSTIKNSKKQITKFRDEAKIKGLKVNTIKDCLQNFSFMIGDHAFSLKTDDNMLNYFEYDFDKQKLTCFMSESAIITFELFWNKECTKFDSNFEQEITRNHEILEKNKSYYLIKMRSPYSYSQYYYRLLFLHDNVIYCFETLADQNDKDQEIKEKLFEAKKLFFTEDGNPIYNNSAYLEDQLALLTNDFHMVLKDSSLLYSVTLSGLDVKEEGTIHFYSTDQNSKKRYGLWNTYISKNYTFNEKQAMKKIKMNGIDGIYSINEKDEIDKIRKEKNPNHFFMNASIAPNERDEYKDVKTEEELIEVLNYYFYIEKGTD